MSWPTSWKVHPHGPLNELEDNLWEVDGSSPGVTIPRRMTVARRRDGGLVVHSAVALDEAAMKVIEAAGPIAYMVVPNGLHRADAPRYAERYPSMKIFVPAGSRKRIEQKVRVDGTYADFPADPDVQLVPEIAGTGGHEGAMIVRSGAVSSLVVADVIMNMPHGGGLQGFLLRYVTNSTGGAKVSSLFRWVTVKDRAALARHLGELASTPGLTRILPAHGAIIAVDAPGTLKKIAEAA